MKKLAEKEYWDSVYSKGFNSQNNPSLPLREKLKHSTRDFSNFVIWEKLLENILPKDKTMKVMEVGCAPGKYLLHFKKIFGYEPFGVEYSEKGYEITKKNFLDNGVNTENIILADFFDQSFQDKNKEKYDVVFSRGFIEHFDDVKRVVSLHTNLLKSQGYLVVMIPNLSGINKVLAKFLNKNSYDLHNTKIMNIHTFSDLFSNNNLNEVFCDYVGLFSWGLFNTNSKWKYYLYRLLLLIQRPFDFVLRVIFKSVNIRYKYSSPYLLFIGRKK